MLNNIGDFGISEILQDLIFIARFSFLIMCERIPVRRESNFSGGYKNNITISKLLYRFEKNNLNRKSLFPFTMGIFFKKKLF